MSIADLTGTTWVFNDVLTPFISGDMSTYSLNISFRSPDTGFHHTGGDHPVDGLRYNNKSGSDWLAWYCFNCDEGHTFYQNGSHLEPNLYKVFTIEGGADVTNIDCITWIETNATAYVPPDLHTYIGNKKIELISVFKGGAMRDVIETSFKPYRQLDSVLANNTWEDIKFASVWNMVPDTWQVGDTKSVQISIGSGYYVTYLFRLVDKQNGRYTRVADNSNCRLVFECVYTMTSSKMSTTMGGAYDTTNPYTWTTGSFINNSLPSDLAAVIEPIYIKGADCAAGSHYYTDVKNIQCTGFIASAAEIWEYSSTDIRYKEAISTSTGEILGPWDYYKIHTTKADIKKTTVYEDAVGYWLRTPSTNSDQYWMNVDTTGAKSGLSYTTTLQICPCFAL